MPAWVWRGRRVSMVGPSSTDMLSTITQRWANAGRTKPKVHILYFYLRHSFGCAATASCDRLLHLCCYSTDAGRQSWGRSWGMGGQGDDYDCQVGYCTWVMEATHNCVTGRLCMMDRSVCMQDGIAQHARVGVFMPPACCESFPGCRHVCCRCADEGVISHPCMRLRRGDSLCSPVAESTRLILPLQTCASKPTTTSKHKLADTRTGSL